LENCALIERNLICKKWYYTR